LNSKGNIQIRIRTFVLYKILLFIAVISFFITPSFSQEPLLSISVSNSSYDEGDSVVISGKVTTIIGETPVIIQISRDGNLIQVEQLQVAEDGTFTHTVQVIGPQWQKEGEYRVVASYASHTADTSFEFFLKETIQDTTDTFEVDAGSKGTFDIEYTIRGGTIKDMIVDFDFYSLIVIIEPTGDGTITLDLPRFAIDAIKPDGADDTFIILIDAIEVPYQETQTGDNTRTITIDFEETDSDIEIIGTFIIPEFGTIASLVLAISIITIIIMSSKTKLLTRY